MPLPPLRPPTCEDLRCFVRGLLARRWIRFGIVGGAATLVYFFCGIAFVTLLGLPVLLGNALAYLAGFVYASFGYYMTGILTVVSTFSFSKAIVRTPSLSSALTDPSSSLTGTGRAIVRENSPQ